MQRDRSLAPIHPAKRLKSEVLLGMLRFTGQEPSMCGLRQHSNTLDEVATNLSKCLFPGPLSSEGENENQYQNSFVHVLLAFWCR